jgi:hypothetical protein
MYVILVSPPGTGKKSSAIEMGTDLLYGVEGIESPPNRMSAEALISIIAESIKTFITPDGRNYVHCSVTITADELEVFINERAGEAIVTLLTGLYQGKDTWTYRIKSAPPQVFHGAWLNLIAGTVPSFFNKKYFLDGCTGGFTARVIFVWGLLKQRFIGMQLDDKLGLELTQNLSSMSLMYGQMHMNKAATTVYNKWYLNLPLTFDTIDELQYYYHRKGTHVLKVSMILAASDNTMTIHSEHIITALAILKRTEKDLPKIFSGVGRCNIGKDTIDIRDMIYDTGEDGIYLADIIQRKQRDIRFTDLKDILEGLKMTDAVREKMCPLTHRSIYYWNAEAEEDRRKAREKRKEEKNQQWER